MFRANQFDEIQSCLSWLTPLLGCFAIFTEYIIFFDILQDLKHRFSCVRKVRGDGNCFYRAFGFRYFETLIEDKADFKRYVWVKFGIFLESYYHDIGRKAVGISWNSWNLFSEITSLETFLKNNYLHVL